jgi:hypothetical protein
LGSAVKHARVEDGGAGNSGWSQRAFEVVDLKWGVRKRRMTGLSEYRHSNESYRQDGRDQSHPLEALH